MSLEGKMSVPCLAPEVYYVRSLRQHISQRMTYMCVCVSVEI